MASLEGSRPSLFQPMAGKARGDTSPDMPATTIPELRRKYDLLLAHSPYRDWAALAKPFGRAPKTVQGWATDARGREAGQMPADAAKILVQLFVDMLPETPRERVGHLVLGPAAHLDEELCVGRAALIVTLIQGAIRGQARLIQRLDESSLIEIDEPDDAAEFIVNLGAWFRIEFPARYDCPHAIALQKAGAAWLLLRTLASEDGLAILVPRRKDGSAGFMRERTQCGRHLFLCLQSPLPFSAAITAYEREPVILDKRGLELVAAFYAGLPGTRRACHLLEVQIEDDPTR